MIGKFFRAIGAWIDRKFPDRLTTGDVEKKLMEHDARLVALETFLPALRVDIAKCKMLVGLEQFTGVSSE